MRRLVSVGAAVGAMAVTAIAGGAGVQAAQAAPADDPSYYARVSGQYATIEGSVGGGLLGNLFSGQVTIGELEAALDSRGISTLNGFGVASGVRSGARGDLAVVGAGGLKVPTDHIIATAPVGTGTVKKTYLPLRLPPVIDAGVPNGDAKAVWGSAAFDRSRAKTVVSTVNGDTAYLKLLDLAGSLGAAGNALPRQFRHAVLEVETLRAHAETTSTRNADGTFGLGAHGIGGLAAVQILGGAANGGVTLGLWNHDTGGEKDTAGTRVWATGKPGGAGCDYTIPDVVQVAVGNSSVALPLSVGQRITIPGGLGYLDVRWTGMSHCEASPDGTYAHATGAGVGISLHIKAPGIGDLADLTVTIPDLDDAVVKVPQGGIRFGDDPGTGATATGATSAGASAAGANAAGATAAGATSAGATAAGATAAGVVAGPQVPSVVDAGQAGWLPDTGGFGFWLPIAALALLGAGALAVRRFRSRLNTV